MPGQYNPRNADPFGLSGPQGMRRNEQQGTKRKYSDEDFHLAGPSTSTGVGDNLFSGKRPCDAFNQRAYHHHDMEPSTSMECDDFIQKQPATGLIYPATLYSHMLPLTYGGTPPAPQNPNSNRPEFPRAAALSPYGSVAPREETTDIGRYQASSFTSSDHCRKKPDSPGPPFMRGGFCRPEGSWEGMISPVPVENDYY